VLALLVLVLRGSSGEGQSNIFHRFLEGYIEETSASVAGLVRLPNSSTFYVNNLASADLTTLGQGGEDSRDTDPELAFVQQSSIMSSSPTSEEEAKNAGISQKHETVDYTVQPGDRLSFIASDYGVTISSILWANNIKDADSIKPGQLIKIPPVSGVVYKVVKGDTVESIAKKFKGNGEKIITFNQLPADGSLQVGSEVIVPDGTIAAGATSFPGQPKRAIENGGRFAYLPNLVNYFILPTTGYSWGIAHGRNGNDIANSCGTPVYASAEGTVAIAQETGWNGGYGRYVKIEHPNGTESLYAHLSKKYVSMGDYAAQGQLIGLVGTTGHSTGCHLHFEVHGAKNPYLTQ
jgi:murein DD-endopeptidase MepM/ murein hydrolase activator NlpD